MDPVSAVYKQKIAEFIKGLKVLSQDNNINIPNLEQFHQGAVFLVKKMFDAKPNLNPVWFLYTENNTLMTLQTTWSDSAEKDWAVEFMRSYMQSIHTKYVCMATEAWAIMLKTEEEVAKVAGRVHEDPRRIEILVISSEDTKNYHSTTFDILRKGWKVALTNQINDFKSLSQVEGRFTGLLKPIKPLQ